MEGLKGECAAYIAAQFPKDEPIAFVDDILEQCESVKAALPQAHCFLMQRKGVMQCSIDTPICPVACLLDVDSIMMSL